MQTQKIPMFDRDGFAKLEGYCLYAAFAPTGDQKTFIKIGISTVPIRRIYEVHCGSPSPIEVALWTHAGSKRQALSVERSIHARLKQFRTRGEWFLMDLVSQDDKRTFHSTCKACFARATGRLLEWRKIKFEQVMELLDFDAKTLAVRRKV